MDYIKSSIKIIKDNQNKNGAYIASPNFETYHYSWFRDGAYIAYAMDLSEEFKSAERFHLWCADVMMRYEGKVKSIVARIGADEALVENEFLPTRFDMEGLAVDDDWTNFQTDGFGTWLWALEEHIALSGDAQVIEKVKPAVKVCVDYLIAVWQVPCYDCWEEHLEYIHTYTLGSIYAGLNAVKAFVPERKSDIDLVLSKIAKYIDSNFVKEGRLIKMTSMAGENKDKEHGVDASLLGMFVPYSIFKPNSDIAKATITVIEKDIYRNEGGVYRYLEDTYFGGGEWVLLACWLGWYYVVAGQIDKAQAVIDWVEEHFDDKNQLPEQVLENVFEENKKIEWEKRWGENAKPLLWSHAMYIILKNSRA